MPIPLNQEGWREIAAQLADALRKVPVNGPITDPRISAMFSALSEYDRRVEMGQSAGTLSQDTLNPHRWNIPSGWTLKSFDNDTFTLTRIDGIQFTSYKTEMTIWGWRLVGELTHGVEGAAQYPDPAKFLPQFDADYPVKN